ncbi:hypothetical protein GJ496_003760 [Pomphorhynchus laevis]|nr:hypothetical protein GJ496_003760 [Pomphorhynchus laevis]
MQLKNETIRTWTRGQRYSRLLSMSNSPNDVNDIVTNENDIHQENILHVNDTNCTCSLIESPHADCIPAHNKPIIAQPQ